MFKKIRLIAAVLAVLGMVTLTVRATGGPASLEQDYFNQGVTLYKAGRFSEAIDAFDKASKKKELAQQAQDYIDRIRKETVDRIRNRALSGISKTTWQNKYYFINNIKGRIRVGISSQELFEPSSLNFRPGAADALMQLANVLQRNDNAIIDVELISERTLEAPEDPELLSQRLTELYSFLSLAAQDALPNYQAVQAQ
jgi:hypothetical protein